MFFGIIDRYVGRTVLSMIFIATVVLTTIAGIVTFIDQTRHLGSGDVDFLFLLWYVCLRLPGLVVILFPIAVLLGGVIGLGLLSKNSELVVMQSSGMSKTQIILSACKLIFPVVLLVSVFGQVVVPEIEQYAENRYNYAESGGRISRTNWGLWLRDGDSFISVRRIMSDNSIHEISRYDFDGINLTKMSTASTGVYNPQNQKWDIFHVRNVVYGDRNLTVYERPMEQWSMYLNPDRMEIFNFKSNELSIAELVDYIDYLKKNNIDSDRYRTALYKKFVLPVAMIVMLLLGASTVFGSLRSVPMSARVLMGLILGFLFYVTNEVLPNFTYIVGLPPIVGVVLPTLIFVVVSLLLLNRKV
ncbi:MAG: LPS export ABC transporter permease LptG [Candidatus Anaerobiospirillum pullicola]|uniref:LPS export ABC transporter permease LptG n=1 Tax=Candidatus Anaerobiospirillum pullicola TaxID=2838451 RepID=A0A948X1Z6_9GAMM|nr:LPS export ABC transporter permease LptG [Candidatus Anaerobiospirillum pullicola]